MNYITSFVHSTIGDPKWRMKYNLASQKLNGFDNEMLPYSTINMEYNQYNKERNVTSPPPLSSGLLVAAFHSMCDDIGVILPKKKFFAKVTSYFLERDVLCVMFCMDTIVTHTELFKTVKVLSSDQLTAIKSSKSLYQKFHLYAIADPVSTRRIIASVKQESLKLQRKRALEEMDLTKLTTDEVGLSRCDPPAVQCRKINSITTLLKEKASELTLTCRSTGKYAGLPSVDFDMFIAGRKDPIAIDVFPVGLIPNTFSLYHSCMSALTENVAVKKRKRV